VTQLAISETQKYGHVTYFWNGNRRQVRRRDSRPTWRSRATRPFEQRPWMKCAEITDRLIDELKTGRYRHARVNYPNGDMVGHTGVLRRGGAGRRGGRPAARRADPRGAGDGTARCW
jgi:2,3-bisphosphoglycerate-independent phosphoglycerate mutase